MRSVLGLFITCGSPVGGLWLSRGITSKPIHMRLRTTDLWVQVPLVIRKLHTFFTQVFSSCTRSVISVNRQLCTVCTGLIIQDIKFNLLEN